MKKVRLFILILALGAVPVWALSIAEKRAERLGIGMNVSYLDQWWIGSREKHYADFASPAEAAKREKMFADIARAGFKTVRIPICFGAWMELGRPYNWDAPKGLEMADSFIKWALVNNLNVIIDLHHTEFDGKIPEAKDPERFVNLWIRIAERYKSTDPEKVFFEIRNEPHDISPEAWRQQAEQIIRSIRRIDQKHTLVVGFHDWNSRQALIDSKPFTDPNIIYTFHYYDPFLFTHQGATWAGEGLPDLQLVRFPWTRESKIDVPSSAKGKWVETLISNYPEDSKAEKIFNDLKAAKNWSVNNKVPIFLGEFGSFTKNPPIEDRCRHAGLIYSSLGKLRIPNAWWEWDGGFNMFEKGTEKIAGCMQKAIDSYNLQESTE